MDETRGGTLTLPEVPGFSLDVAPGSVTFPEGGKSGVVSVTAVHADKIPMAPGAGMQPRLIVTVPAGGSPLQPALGNHLPEHGRPPARHSNGALLLRPPHRRLRLDWNGDGERRRPAAPL